MRSKIASLSIVRVVCATLFIVFAFCWFYWFQADMLAIAQHELSNGVTTYNRLVGALILTVSLVLVQLLVFALTGLEQRTHALTYVPSFMLLAFVSSIGRSFKWETWGLVSLLVLTGWIGAVAVAKKALPFDKNSRAFSELFSRLIWLNVLQMGGMMLLVAAVSNTNAVDHFKARAEAALMKNDADEALRVGKRSLETDESLTMLRIFALAQKGQLAESLFEYPVSGCSTDMLPLMGSKSQLRLMPDTLMWDFLGLRPDSILARADSIGRLRIIGGRLTTTQYLDSLANDSLVAKSTTAWRDYRLVGLLIDRQLDSFAQQLEEVYPLCADSLPRHYREALMLYSERVDTAFHYRDTLMLSRWHDFCRYDTLYPAKSERRLRSEEDFKGTYWYYYFR